MASFVQVIAPDTPKQDGPVTPAAETEGAERAQTNESETAETDEKEPEQLPLTVSTPATGSPKKNDGPFHLLMLPANEQPKAQVLSMEPMMLMDRGLRRGYLSRRFRAYHFNNKHPAESETGHAQKDSKSEPIIAGSSSSTEAATSPTTTNGASPYKSRQPRTTSMDLWSGASMLERELVGCCELPPSEPPEDGDSSSSITDDEAPGGSLAKGFEVRFTGLVAKHCHSLGSRILALAILERSLEQDKKDALEATNCSNVGAADTDDDGDGDDENDSNSSTPSMKECEEDEEEGESEQERSESEDEQDSGDDEDYAYDPSDKAISSGRDKRNQQQRRGRGRPPKRAKITPTENLSASKRKSTRTLRPRVTASADKSSKKTKHASEENKKEAPKAEVKRTKGKTKSTEDLMKMSEKESDDVGNGESKNGMSCEGEDSQPDRMSAFLAAGGLKILRSWLVDAMTPVLIPASKASSSIKEESSTTNVATRSASVQLDKFEPSQYGPMLLPLLTLLSEIPFEMKLIVESKINKQIRRLSKQVNGLVDNFKTRKQQTARQKGQENGRVHKAPVTLETFVDPAVGGCVVVKVQEVLDKLKETWEAHAKKDSHDQEVAMKIVDPYESIRSKLKVKLEVLKECESGNIEKPGWLLKCGELQRERAKKRPRRVQAVWTHPNTAASNNNGSSSGHVSQPKANTQQLALKEREAERIALQDKLKAVQEERKAHLERLKNQISKRTSSQPPLPQELNGDGGNIHGKPVRLKKTGKTVKWKDGLSDDKVRKRDILEEVFLLKEEAEALPLSPNSGSSTNDESAEKTGDAEPEHEVSTIKSSAGEFGLFEMFDYDETLLL